MLRWVSFLVTEVHPSMILAIWLFTLVVVALWSAAAWGLHSLLGFDALWVSRLEPWLARMPFGGWLETWLPNWMDLARSALEALQSFVEWLGGAAPVLVWALWAVGTFAICLASGLLTLVVVMVRRSAQSAPSNTPPASPPAAA